RTLSVAVDVWGLGAVLYELLTGTPAFDGGTRDEVLERVKHGSPRRPTALAPALPRDLEVICLKCLAREPARRYGSAEELAADLERFLAGEPISARSVGRTERLWRWCRREPAVAALSGAVVVLVVGIVIGLAAAALTINE